MTWLDTWGAVMMSTPAVPTSMEESVGDLLARIITGAAPVYFEPRTPTIPGARFLRGVTDLAFGVAPGDPITDFHCEFALPVPVPWRTEIPYTYRSPDLVWRAGERLILVELKTRTGSYDPRQVPDYLRLARHAFPDDRIGAVLLARSVPVPYPSSTIGSAMPNSRGRRSRRSSPTRSQATQRLQRSLPSSIACSRARGPDPLSTCRW